MSSLSISLPKHTSHNEPETRLVSKSICLWVCLHYHREYD